MFLSFFAGVPATLRGVRLRKFLAIGVLGLGLTACTEVPTRSSPIDLPATTSGPRILAIGDSLMSSNSFTGNSIADALEEYLGQEVVDKSLPGAFMDSNGPLSVFQQFEYGNWDWVVINGGGNDLWLGCGCRRCDAKMDRLVSKDGYWGEIPRVISQARNAGAKVVYVGYLRSPGLGSPIEHCKDEGDELEKRIQVHANRDAGVYFLSLKSMVPHGDSSFHGIDMIHPSIKASRSIGKSLAAIIR